MKFAVSDLKKFLLLNEEESSKISEKLTNIGLEVESLIDQKELYKNIVIGYVKKTEKHPNADKLNVCLVDVGESDDLQIVCGASNVRAGLFVPVAKIGTIVPNGGFIIKKSKIRSIESCGMICSENELSLSQESEGIMEIATKDENIGKNFSDLMNLNETIIEISITPNKGDCLSMLGLARVLAGANFGKLKENYINEILNQNSSFVFKNFIKNSFKNEKKISILDQSCEYFSLMELKNIKNIKTPEYIQKTLKFCGLRSHNLIIDATNYTMFMIGKPTHAYDNQKIIGNDIKIFKINEDKFTDLKGNDHKLKEILCVNDENGAISIAGIIGGKESSISDKTQNILLESAVFKSEEIYKSGQKINVISDARFRFERGVDSEINEFALELIASIIKLENPDAQFSEIVSAGKKAESKKINFNLNSIKSLTGLEISESEILKILEKNWYKIISKNDNFLTLEVPSFKNHISIEQDVVGEIMISYGIENVKSTPFEIKKITKTTDIYDTQNAIIRYLSHNGYIECINYSFGNTTDIDNFSKINDSMKILNPININMEYMLPTKIISHLKIIKNNINNFRFDQIKLSEKGALYFSTNTDENTSIESITISNYFNFAVSKIDPKASIKSIKNDFLGIVSRYFSIDSIDIDFIDISQFLSENSHYFKILKSDNPERIRPKIAKLLLNLEIKNDFFNQNESFIATIDEIPVAIIGNISKNILNKFEVNSNDLISVCELYSDILKEFSKTKKRNDKITDSVFRNFSILVKNTLNPNKILRFIRDKTNKLIKNPRLIEIYSNDSYKKDEIFSLNIEIEIEKTENSSTIEGINEIFFDCIDKVKKEFNATLRDGKI